MTLNQTTLRLPSGWRTLLKCPLSQSFQRQPYGPAPTRPERPLPSVKLSDAKDRARCTTVLASEASCAQGKSTDPVQPIRLRMQLQRTVALHLKVLIIRINE